MISLWLYGSIRGGGVGAGAEPAVRRKPAVPVAVRGREHELPHAGRFPCGSCQGAGRIVHAGDRVAGGQEAGEGDPHQPGRHAGAGVAGASSFRGEQRLDELLKEAEAHVDELSKQLDCPEKSAGLSAKKKAAKKRAARERAGRIEAAIKQLPAIKQKQKKAAEQAGNGSTARRSRRASRG